MSIISTPSQHLPTHVRDWRDLEGRSPWGIEDLVLSGGPGQPQWTTSGLAWIDPDVFFPSTSAQKPATATEKNDRNLAIQAASFPWSQPCKGQPQKEGQVFLARQAIPTSKMDEMQTFLMAAGIQVSVCRKSAVSE